MSLFCVVIETIFRGQCIVVEDGLICLTSPHFLHFVSQLLCSGFCYYKVLLALQLCILLSNLLGK